MNQNRANEIAFILFCLMSSTGFIKPGTLKTKLDKLSNMTGISVVELNEFLNGVGVENINREFFPQFPNSSPFKK
jgi:hypothetical protein